MESMSSVPPGDDAEVTGLDMLKAVWNIRKKTREREKPPAHVCTDIYARQPRPKIPPRARSHD